MRKSRRSNAEAQHLRDVEIRAAYWRRHVPPQELAARYGLPLGYMMREIIYQPLEAMTPKRRQQKAPP